MQKRIDIHDIETVNIKDEVRLENVYGHDDLEVSEERELDDKKVVLELCTYYDNIEVVFHTKEETVVLNDLKDVTLGDIFQ